MASIILHGPAPDNKQLGLTAHMTEGEVRNHFHLNALEYYRRNEGAPDDITASVFSTLTPGHYTVEGIPRDAIPGMSIYPYIFNIFSFYMCKDLISFYVSRFSCYLITILRLTGQAPLKLEALTPLRVDPKFLRHVTFRSVTKTMPLSCLGFLYSKSSSETPRQLLPMPNKSQRGGSSSSTRR